MPVVLQAEAAEPGNESPADHPATSATRGSSGARPPETCYGGLRAPLTTREISGTCLTGTISLWSMRLS